MSDDTRLRPVLTLETTLASLEALGDSGDPRRGPLRQRALNAARALPAGSLSAERRESLLGRLEAALGEEVELPARATSLPSAKVGVTWWLSGHDDAGAVLRVRLDRLGHGERPWPNLWPGPDADAAAESAAERAWELAARALAHRPLAPLRGWHRVVPLDLAHAMAPTVAGGSMGAPLALMLLSSWLGQPLDPEVAVTGDLDDRGRLTLGDGAARSVAAKARAVCRERSSIRRLLVPAGLEAAVADCGLDVRGVESLDALAVQFGLDVTGAYRATTLTEWLEAIEEARWLTRVRGVEVSILHERLEALLDAWTALEPLFHGDALPWSVRMARLELLTLACTHRAQLDLRAEAAESAEALAALLAEESSPPTRSGLAARARNVLASVLIEEGRFDEARRHADRAREDAAAANHAAEAARVASTRGRIEAHAGDDPAALPHFHEALARFAGAAPWEANICRCYHLGVLTRLGRHEEARAAYARAEAANDEASGMSEGWRQANALYLAWEGLKLALADDDSDLDAAVRRMTDRLAASPEGPWPRAACLGRLVEAAARLDDAEAAGHWYHLLEVEAERWQVPSVHAQLGRASAAVVLEDLRRRRTPSGTHRERARAWANDQPAHLEALAAQAREALGRNDGPTDALERLLASSVR